MIRPVAAQLKNIVTTYHIWVSDMNEGWLPGGEIFPLQFFLTENVTVIHTPISFFVGANRCVSQLVFLRFEIVMC